MEAYVTVVEDETGKGWCPTINEFIDGERKITKSEPRYSHHAAVTEARAIALTRNIKYIG